MATYEEALSKLQDIWKPGSSRNDEGDISDISSGTSGEIAILWHNSQKRLSNIFVYKLNERGSYVCRTTETINRESKEIVAFMGSNIVVSFDTYLELYVTDFSRRLQKRKLQTTPSCMFVHRSSLFLTLVDSSKVMVYSPELVKESEICLKDIDKQQYPVDLAVTESFIFICTTSSGKAMSFVKTTGNKQVTFEPTQEHISFAISITVNATADLVFVLFKTNHILLFSLKSPRCLAAIDFAAVKIRALQKSQLVAVHESGVHTFEMKTMVLHKLMRKLNEMTLQQTELERKLSEEQDKRNQYQDSLEKKTKELDELKEKLKEIQLQQTEIQRKLSEEEKKRNEYKGSLDKKTKELDELKEKLKEMQLQQTEIQRKLSEEQKKRNEYKGSLDKKTKELDELKEKLKEMQLQQTEIQRKLSEEEKKRNEYKGSLDKKTKELGELKEKLTEMQLQQTEIQRKLSEEEKKRNEYKGSLDKTTTELDELKEKLKEMQLQQTELEGNLDKKTTQLQELTHKLHALKSQKTELEKKLSGYQTSTRHREAIEKETKLVETIDRMKSAEKERAKQLSKERKRDMDHQEAIKKMLQTVQSHIDGLNESIENFTYQKRTFIGDSQPDTGLSTTDPEEDSSIGGETIRKGDYNTIASKESGISIGSNATGQDEAVKEEPSKLHSETIHSFLKEEDKFSTSMYKGNYFNLVVAANIGTEGGELEIPGTNSSISIPPKALRQQEDITIRIVPPETWMEESESFASNSFSIIELLPNNLKLDKPAKVKIPHCLQIARRAKPKVEIYISHHEENFPPHWERSTEHKYKLEDDVCTVYTSSFCWIKVEIDDQIVEAKKIQVFATVPKITPGDSTSLFTIGYFPDLLGFTHGKEAIEKKYFLFKKDKEQPLSIALKKTVPKFWNNEPPSSPQEIPFSDIELSKDRCCNFTLLKSRSCRGIPLCMFTVSQGTREISLSVRPPISSS